MPYDKSMVSWHTPDFFSPPVCCTVLIRANVIDAKLPLTALPGAKVVSYAAVEGLIETYCTGEKSVVTFVNSEQNGLSGLSRFVKHLQFYL